MSSGNMAAATAVWAMSRVMPATMINVPSRMKLVFSPTIPSIL